MHIILGTRSCLFDKHIECADTTTITSRHTIDFIHDQACTCTYADACDRCALFVSFCTLPENCSQLTCRPVPLKKPSREALSMLVEFYPSAKTKRVGIAYLHKLLTPSVTRIELYRIIPSLLGHQVRRGGLSNTRWSGD